jgi:beta-lactamase class A
MNPYSEMKKFFFRIYLFAAAAMLASCSTRNTNNPVTHAATDTDALRDSISAIISDVTGEIGVAAIIDSKDTVTVNDIDKYALMSVFKMHQAVAICHSFDLKGTPLDTIIEIDRTSLNPDTWSPMLKEHDNEHFSTPVSELLRYTLMQSDNNASNLMFDRLVSVAETDSFIATLIPRNSFRITERESDMQSDHSRSYNNHSSPLGVAMLVERLFTDSILSHEKQEFICETMRSCSTGTDRIAAPLINKDGITIAHKTGSGYINENGRLIAHNDAAYITLPDGTSYTLVILVKDFAGNEKQAAAIMARISDTVYQAISQDKSHN